MPDLPEVTQTFDANTLPYITGIEAAISATNDLKTAVEELSAAIAAIPDKTIDINDESVVSALITVEALSAAIRDIPDKTVNVHVAQEGTPHGAAPDTAAAEAAAKAAEDNAAATDKEAVADQHLNDVLKELGGGFQELDALLGQTSAAEHAAAASAGEAANALHGEASAVDPVRAAYQSLVNQGLDPMDAAWSVVMNKAGPAGEAIRTAGADAAAAAVPFAALGKDAEAATVPFERIGGASDSAAAGMGALALAAAGAGKATRDAGTAAGSAGAAAAASGAAAAGAGWGWGILNRDVTLWAGLLGSGALIGSVKLWHVALDGVLEAAIALGSALAALSIGLYAMSGAAQDIYNHLNAVKTVNSALGSSIPPLTGQFDDLKRAMASQTVEAFGGALNLLGSNMTHISQIASQVVTGLDDWIAKLDLWKQAQSSMGGVLDTGVAFLHQFEQVVNNVGQAIVNLVRSDPGTAHYLMDIVVGFTELLKVVTSIPQPILMAALALHSFQLWGGIAFTQLSNLLGPLRSIALTVGGIDAAGTALKGLGKDASGLDKLKATVSDIGTGFGAALGAIGAWGKGIVTAGQEADQGGKLAAMAKAAFGGLTTALAGLAANPLTWVVGAAIGLGVLAYQAYQASAGTKAFVAAMDQGVAQATASQAIPLITSDVGQLNVKLAESTQQWKNTQPGIQALTGSWSNFFHTWMNGFKEAIGAGDTNSKAFQAEIDKLLGSQKNLFAETGNLISQGYTYSQSLALMDLAGVKAGDALDLMKQKVANLITGYQNMGVQGGMLANATAAVTFAAELQNSKIQQLTQSFTTFLGVVTGGESALVTAEQGLTGLATAATGAGTKMTVANGQTRLTTSATAGLGAASASTATQIGGLSTSSQQLTSTWIQAITNGGHLVDSMLTQSAAAGMGAKGYNLVSSAAKDYMQQLLPMAQGNQLATQQLYALAQTAGYQGAPSFQALSQWIGKTSNASQDLQNKETTLTTASAGLTNDMNALANAISGNLNAAMSAAILQANGGQTAFNNFANAAVKGKGSTDGMTSSATALANELIQTTGNTNQAHAMFDTFSGSLGIGRQKADELWKSITTASGAVLTAGGNANSTAGNMGTLSGSLFDSTNKASALSTALNSIHSVSATVSVNYVSYGAIPGGAAGSIQAKLVGQQGFRVPGGYGGGDIVPAMLEPGETVVPKHLTSAVAPLMKAHSVPGFDRGGIMGGGIGSGPLTPGHLTAGWFGGDWNQQPGWGDRDDHRRGGRGDDRRWGGGDDDRRMHVHLEMDGREIGNAMVPYSAAAAGRYQLRNSGRATGSWGTGWRN